MPGPAALAELRDKAKSGKSPLPPAPAYRDAAFMVEALRGKLPETVTTITSDPQRGHEIREQGGVRLRAQPVAWAIPTDEVLYARFFTNFLRLRAMPWDDLYTIGSTYLPDARNTLHRFFVEKSECEHLVMLDSDVLPPPDFLERLLAHKLPLVGGWYRKKDEAGTPCVYDYVKQETDGTYWWNARSTPGTGLEQVDGAGAGCWLMHKDVARALGPKPYDMNQGGEDLTLCKRVTELGFPIWIDWTVACAHAGVAYA
jgi:hypothetical protein